jgi:IS5 family transposase
MLPRKINNQETDLFMILLENLIDLNHPLCVVARDLNWDLLESELRVYYSDSMGSPGKPIRLMAGLLYLKGLHDLSDDALLGVLRENPYWQYFCGFTHFQHRIDLDSSSLTRFRKRIGDSGMDILNKAILGRAIDHKYLRSSDLKRVNIDSTVMEKDIKYPTDVDLYYDMLRVLVREAKASGVKLRQSYKRVSKSELLKSKQERHRRHPKQALRHQRKVRTYLGRITRELRRKLVCPDPKLSELLDLSERLLEQSRHSKDKIYSVFEPHVYCVAKGKSSKKYEFGCKVSIATTVKDNWIVGVYTSVKNKHDSKLLGPTLENMESLTDVRPSHAVVDRGFRGKQRLGETEVILPKAKSKMSRKILKWVKQRSRIEAIFSHLKNDHGMGRNLLKGIIGDLINAKLTALGWNLKKLMRKLLFVLKSLGLKLIIQIDPQYMIAIN